MLHKRNYNLNKAKIACFILYGLTQFNQKRKHFDQIDNKKRMLPELLKQFIVNILKLNN